MGNPFLQFRCGCGYVEEPERASWAGLCGYKVARDCFMRLGSVVVYDHRWR